MINNNNKSCINLECSKPFDPPSGYGDFCSKKCRNKFDYNRKRDYLQRLNEIPREIKKQDKILKKVHEKRGSNLTPYELLRYEGFEDGGYSKRVQHPTTDEEILLFLEYGVHIDRETTKVKIYPSYDL